MNTLGSMYCNNCPWTSRHSRAHIWREVTQCRVFRIVGARPLSTLSVKARMFVQVSVCQMNIFAKPNISCLVVSVTANH